MHLVGQSRRTVVILALLALITVGCFLRGVPHGFTSLDDSDYVLGNPHVTSGLSWANIGWAFTSSHAFNWHPLTWLSHMFDVQLFGLQPAGHHATSLFLHVVNVVLLFLALRRLTGAEWRSAVVAALFAIHPLRVESVVWIAERKDVLSGFFFLLTLYWYAGYAQASGNSALAGNPALRSRFYALSLASFALGLMSKPMLVTVPFVLLLLDSWPLGRCAPGSTETGTGVYRRLIVEKVPFLLLSLASSLVTCYAQTRAVAFSLPLERRVMNSVASWWRYVGKTFWPSDLAVFYPHPDLRYPEATRQWPIWLVILAAIALALTCIAACRQLRRGSYLSTGWLWFVGMLVPVIGLMQVGAQAMADRYTYLPSIGLFICVVWGAAAILGRFLPDPGLSRLGAAGAAIALVSCGVLTFRQVDYWKDDYTLFTHALEAGQDCMLVRWRIGTALAQQGRLEEALPHFRAAMETSPDSFEAHTGLAIVLENSGRLSEAATHYRQALQLRPDVDWVRHGYASALWRLDQRTEAVAQFRHVLAQRPTDSEVRCRLGEEALEAGNPSEAAAWFLEALKLQARYPDALNGLGRVLTAQGRWVEALARLNEAARLCPTNAQTHLNLGEALLVAGQTNEARVSFTTALRLAPDLPERCRQAARSAAARGRSPEAINRLRAALTLRPDWPAAMSDLAWILATHRSQVLRNGAEAVRLAERACAIAGDGDAALWCSLDAAYAEEGRFPDAIRAATKARDLAAAAGQADRARAAEARLALYQKNLPFHQH